MNIRCVCPQRLEYLEDDELETRTIRTIRHPDGDTINLRARLDFVQAIAIRNAIRLKSAGEALRVADVLAILTEGYIIHGIESWTLEDDDGPIAVSREAIAERILTQFDVAAEIGDEADELYSEQVLLPLVARVSTSSRPTPMPDSTSAKTSSGPKRRKPSSRSSISTTPTAGTAPTS